MRTNLFLSTLFAVSLVGGAALAETPVKAVDRLRSHGDLVDKQYKGGAAAQAHVTSKPEAGTASPQKATHNPVDRAASRVNCSDTGADCAAPKGQAHQSGAVEGGPSEAGRAAQRPAFLDKVLGSDRMVCNEADECMMSSRAASRAWSGGHAAAGHTSGTMPLSKQEQESRMDGQASGDRMSCNDGDQCMMSSKAAKKDWSYESIKKGTWKGPEAPQKSNAQRAVDAMKAEETAKNEATANRGSSSGKTKGGSAKQGDHEH